MVKFINSARRETFVYSPPDAVFGAVRILVNWTEDRDLLAAVLRGVRRANPHARIVIVAEGIDDLLDDNMRAAQLEDLMMAEYVSRLNSTVMVIAPVYVGEYDCCINVGSLDTLCNLLRDVPESLVDVYFAIGHLFHGAVMAGAGGRVVWGDDLLDVEESACGEPLPPYIRQIREKMA